MLSRPLFLALLLAVSSCDDTREPATPIDGWAATREALRDGSVCYGETPLLCLDEAFIDAAIEGALEGRWKGTMPSKPRDVDQVVRAARTEYRKAAKSPEALEQLAALVKERYANPSVDTTTAPGVASADLGALPGELQVTGPRGAGVVLSKTALLDGHEWDAAEAGKRLAEVARAHPDAKEIRVEVRAPRNSARHFVVRYLRATNVVLFDEIAASNTRPQFISNPIEGGIEALARGDLRVGKEHGKRCIKVSQGESPSCSAIPDPYLAAKKKGG
jgi:hypothetical protein